MILLLIFAFLAGIITILSPCILPILPIVLSGSVGSGKRKPLGIVTGFVLSFTFFTLFLATIVQATGFSADALRSISVIIILLFGMSLFLPQFQLIMERLFSKLSGKFALQGVHEGFGGGLVVGISLGLVWTPCVGPIIASVITLAAISSVTFSAFLITLAYSLGTAIPMFAIMLGGRSLLQKVPWLLPNTGRIQKAFGVLMILTAIGIFFNVDRRFQTYILDTFPQYGVGLTQFEDNETVKKQLDTLRTKDTAPASSLENFGQAPELIPAGEWINTQPLRIQELRGKVVLVDFWTYTCINCIRTLPYLKSWHEKYKDDGLVIIGVHTPEFAFERDTQNVQDAVSDFAIEYPVMQDNEYATWEAYSNRYWPAKYLIDKDGKIRYTHFGEGAYEETEQIIQELLKDAGSEVSDTVSSAPDAVSYSDVSPETYLGSRRMQYLDPGGRVKNGTKEFVLSQNLREDMFSLGGIWTIDDEYAKSGNSAVLEYRFTARNVFLVMNPPIAGVGRVRVLLDGNVVSDGAGEDVKDGIVTVDKNRLYKLLQLSKTGTHVS